MLLVSLFIKDRRKFSFKKTFVELIFLFAAVFSASLSAQTTVPLNFEYLTINDGLSQGYISGIVQDKKGLMWFATGDGLNKYDGYNFTVYHHDSDDTTSLGSDDLTCIFEDSKQRLWIGTRHDGIDLFDRENNSFMHIRQRTAGGLSSDFILGITEDRLGHLWIRSREGIDRLEIVSGKSPPSARMTDNPLAGDSLSFIHITIDSLFESERNKYGPENIFIDSRDHIFITTNRILWELIFYPDGQTYTLIDRYQLPVADSLVVAQVLEDTINHSLLLNYKDIVRFPNYKFTAPQKIYEYQQFKVEWGIDKRQMLWVAGLNILHQVDLRSGKSRDVISADPYQTRWLSSTTKFFTDRTGVTWIGTGGHGLVKYDPEIEHFQHILPGSIVYQLAEMQPGNILTSGFKSVLIGRDKPVEVNQLIDSGLIREKFPRFPVISFAKDTAQNLWIGINGAVIRYNTKDRSTMRFDIPYAGLATLPFPLYADRKGNIWMGYNKYFVRYEPASGKFSRYAYPLKTQSYDYDFLQSIYEDDGLLWLGSINGVFSFDIGKEQMKAAYLFKQGDNTSLSNNFILSFCSDILQPAKYLWIGTKGGGLNRLDKSTGKFVHFDTRSGLVNNVVYGILPGRDGNLWLSTNNGLSAYDPQSGLFRNFDVSDGLQSNEFNRYAYCTTQSGLLVFGGMNGINYFDPLQIRPLHPPAVIFTDFRLFNKKVNPHQPGSPISKDISVADKIRLRYDQNVITLQFAGMDYRKTGNIVYRYRMQGFDKDWIYSGTAHEATYTNLDPDSYRFVVEAAFANGVWGEPGASIAIVVIPPWWRTWWFYLLSVITVFSVSYGLYRFRLYQLRRLEKLRNRIARDLHDEVGSSLSTISIYSKIVHEQVDNATFDNEPLLKKITDYATEIMESMNDIVWNINTKNDAFEHIISRMREHAFQLLEAKGYDLHFDFDDNLYRMKLEMEKRRDFYLIYKEALNNIAKYAAGKNVWIKLVVHNNHLHLSIRDDGKGFDSSTIRKGGNGVSNMNFRAKTLNGTITIISAPGEGTTINLNF